MKGMRDTTEALAIAKNQSKTERLSTFYFTLDQMRLSAHFAFYYDLIIIYSSIQLWKQSQLEKFIFAHEK